MEPPTDQKKGVSRVVSALVLDGEAEGKQEASAGAPRGGFLAGGGRMAFPLRCSSSGGVMMRIALTLRGCCL